jgi:hypothetical protein
MTSAYKFHNDDDDDNDRISEDKIKDRISVGTAQQKKKIVKGYNNRTLLQK